MDQFDRTQSSSKWLWENGNLLGEKKGGETNLLFSIDDAFFDIVLERVIFVLPICRYVSSNGYFLFIPLNIDIPWHFYLAYKVDPISNTKLARKFYPQFGVIFRYLVILTIHSLVRKISMVPTAQRKQYDVPKFFLSSRNPNFLFRYGSKIAVQNGENESAISSTPQETSQRLQLLDLAHNLTG